MTTPTPVTTSETPASVLGKRKAETALPLDCILHWSRLAEREGRCLLQNIQMMKSDAEQVASDQRQAQSNPTLTRDYDFASHTLSLVGVYVDDHAPLPTRKDWLRCDAKTFDETCDEILEHIQKQLENLVDKLRFL
jgi:hypothetical protein